MNLSFVRHLPSSSLFALFPLLIFSYLPVISLGMAFGVHLDISLLYAALVLVFLVNILVFWKQRSILLSSLAWKCGAAFLGFIWISCLYSSNPFRAVVTASFFTLVFGIFSAILIHLPTLLKQKSTIMRLVSYSFVLTILLALWQIIADALYVSPTLSLLPAMYSGDIFGVARPTAFALEPQFLGSLLLAPFIYTAYRCITRTSRSDVFLFAAVAVILLLTLSRGALVGGAIGLILLLILVRPAIKSAVRLLLTGVAAVVVTLAVIAIIGSVRQDSTSGYAATNKVINQLSLGTISLPNEKIDTKNVTIEPSAPPATPSQSGYVESSTDSRLSMSAEALQLWNSSPSTLLFGVGIGGFGASLHAKDSAAPESSIVNNFYLELLAETGVVGTILFLCFLGALLYAGTKSKQYILVSLLAAFLLHWCFFSGISNVTHIWVILGLLAASTVHPLKNKRT